MGEEEGKLYLSLREGKGKGQGSERAEEEGGRRMKRGEREER